MSKGQDKKRETKKKKQKDKKGNPIQREV